jgi:hypothetical protein
MISRNPDNNIFHILYDLYMYYDANYSDIYIYYDEQTKNIDINNPCQKWRKFLLECIFQCKVKYTNQFCIQFPQRNPFQHTRYIKYDKDPVFVEMLKHIITSDHGKYILLNQRKENNRYMYDTITGLPIHIFLQQNQDQFHIPFKFCCFDDMTPEEQYHICSEAALFISAHGAACSNMIFTPSSTPMIEINFRKDWYCDPVCDQHYHNKISFDTKCNGQLLHAEYHKADFHNLSHLLGKKYYEITPDRYSGKFRDRNPISKENIHINGQYLVKLIHKITTSLSFQKSHPTYPDA